MNKNFYVDVYFSNLKPLYNIMINPRDLDDEKGDSILRHLRYHYGAAVTGYDFSPA